MYVDRPWEFRPRPRAHLFQEAPADSDGSFPAHVPSPSPRSHRIGFPAPWIFGLLTRELFIPAQRSSNWWDQNAQAGLAKTPGQDWPSCSHQLIQRRSPGATDLHSGAPDPPLRCGSLKRTAQRGGFQQARQCCTELFYNSPVRYQARFRDEKVSERRHLPKITASKWHHPPPRCRTLILQDVSLSPPGRCFPAGFPHQPVDFSKAPLSPGTESIPGAGANSPAEKVAGWLLISKYLTSRSH